jgi:hypothetical protein
MRSYLIKLKQKVLTVKIKEFPRVKNSETVIDFPFLVESNAKN